jgi:ATP-dependent protease Clp ATPase subunit
MKDLKLPVIGQDKLVKEIERIYSIFDASEGSITPHFILTGESGSGKTFTINSLAVKYKMNFIEINAAQLTKEGTSGNSLSKALTPMLNFHNDLTVIFVDEFDKLFISGNSNDSSAHESTTGVQNEFLKLLEGRTTQVFGDYGKYISVPLDKVLFVFAGAFNNEKDMTLDRLREIGLKTEFLGRVGLVYATEPLSFESLCQIIDNSDLLGKYCKLFDEDFEKVALYLKGYLKKFYENNTLGARMINTLIQQYFIKGGVLNLDDAKEITFQNKLKLN